MDPAFYDKVTKLKNELLENNNRSFINFFKSYISAYQQFYE